MKTPTRYLSVLLIAFALTFSWSTLPAPVFAASAVGGEFQLWGGFLHLLGGFFRFGVANSGGSGSDTTPPTAPTNLTAVASSSSELDLSWTASNDNGGGDAVTGYKIFRAGSQVGTSTQTGYADTGLAASTTYAYTVKAFDAAGNVSTASNIATSTSGTWADGFAGATPVTAQYPALLQGYATRPSWRVAGVDYAVGAPNITFKVVGVDTDPPGWVSSSRTMQPTQDNAILDGWDLNGRGLYNPNGYNNVTIQNCKGEITSADVGMFYWPAGNNVTVQHCTFNGLGSLTLGTQQATDLVTFGLMTGTATFQYNYLIYPIQHFVVYNAHSGSLVMKYNLLQDGGTVFAAHMNYLQWGNTGNVTGVIEFNTAVQHGMALGLLSTGFTGAGGTVGGSPAAVTLTSPVVNGGNPVSFTPASSDGISQVLSKINAALGVSLDGSVNGVGAYQQNGNGNLIFNTLLIPPGSTSLTLGGDSATLTSMGFGSGNRDVSTAGQPAGGEGFQFSASTAMTFTFSNNTMVSFAFTAGPAGLTPFSSMVHGADSPNNVASGTLSANYLDQSGAGAAWYFDPNANGAGANLTTYTGNFNMVTGASCNNPNGSAC